MAQEILSELQVIFINVFSHPLKGLTRSTTVGCYMTFSSIRFVVASYNIMGL
jgi:hypothetical protein